MPNDSAPKTVGHGLGVAPKLIIMKYRSQVSGWSVYHSSLGNTGRLLLNSSAAFDVTSAYWNNTSPTSTVFTLGSNFLPEAATPTIVAYCWSEVEGFSKFGSYTGNGSTDGPFIYTGFRPKFILIKNSSISQGWNMRDTSVNSYNLSATSLSPSTTGAELTSYSNMDILSNGFKLRETDAYVNGSGHTMVYMAFAENPFKNSLAR
jgi:hypothetical protein